MKRKYFLGDLTFWETITVILIGLVVSLITWPNLTIVW